MASNDYRKILTYSIFTFLALFWRSLVQNVKQMKFHPGMTSAIEFYNVKNRLASTLLAKLILEIKKRMLGFYKGTRFWEWV